MRHAERRMGGHPWPRPAPHQPVEEPEQATTDGNEGHAPGAVAHARRLRKRPCPRVHARHAVNPV
jgi:hypothetical protein